MQLLLHKTLSTILGWDYFQVLKRSFEQVWQETKNYYQKSAPEVIADIEGDPKKKMALIFRWYFVHSTRLAMSGSREQLVDYQIQCGPAMGAFNQWVKGTKLEKWQSRHVAEIAEMIVVETAKLLSNRFGQLYQLDGKIAVEKTTNDSE